MLKRLAVLPYSRKAECHRLQFFGHILKRLAVLFYSRKAECRRPQLFGHIVQSIAVLPYRREAEFRCPPYTDIDELSQKIADAKTREALDQISDYVLLPECSSNTIRNMIGKGAFNEDIRVF
jgi:hypothetical protein